MMNLNRKNILFIFVLVLVCTLVYGKKFQIVVKQISSNSHSNKFTDYSDRANLPIYSISSRWPVSVDDLNNKMPPEYIPVMLEIDLIKLQLINIEIKISQFKNVLKKFINIKYIVLKGLDFKDSKFRFFIKKISTAARGIIPGIKIGIAFGSMNKKKQIIKQLNKIILNKEILPYFNALYLSSLKYKKRIQKIILTKAPSLKIWQSLSEIIKPQMKPVKIISAIFKSDPYIMINTTLLIVPSNNFESLFKPLDNLNVLVNFNLYKHFTKTKIKNKTGKTLKLDNYIKPEDQSKIIFCNTDQSDNIKIYFGADKYKRSIIINLLNGKTESILIKKNAEKLNLFLKMGFYAINLIPAKTDVADLNYDLNVSGTYIPSAEEIIAKVRIWKETVRTRLNSFIAEMSSSLRLRIANLNETFDLTISGPMFSARNKPYDWVWEKFYINGVEWKSKKVPKIPLLQPGKVKLLPIDLSLSEEYDYKFVRQTRLDKHPVYIIDFKPKKKFRSKSSYYGTLWIDKNNFFIRKEHLVQINLKGEVLSNIETRFYKQIGRDPQILLPVLLKGHQVFSIAGRITNIEKKVIINKIKLNPADFSLKIKNAYRSDLQIVRDTNRGLRYLVKDKKNKKRKVEWETKKSQLLLVLGGYADSSLSYPIPIVGLNYMNFDLGGKGKQINILFGGAMLTANFSDPSLFGSKIDFGANLIAIAFPFNNAIYRNNQKIQEETVKRWPFKFQINTGFPIGPYLKLSSFLFLNYDHYSKAKHTSENFIVPKSTITFGLRSRLTANLNGYKLSLWGAISKRNKWQEWGIPGNEFFDPKHKSFYRWRFTVSKDYFLSGFKKIHFTLGYFDGINLDRFNSYKFGFFNELKMHGFMSGVVQASRAYMLNLSYGYNIGKVFRLEVSYDSALATNKFNYKNTYFSSTALSGTINISGINMICRFEAGFPVFSNGIKGYVFYMVLMKML